MADKNLAPQLVSKTIFAAYNFFVKAVMVVFAAAAFIMLLSQTSFSPLNLKLVADYSYEQTLSLLRPYQKYFPRPVVLDAEEPTE